MIYCNPQITGKYLGVSLNGGFPPISHPKMIMFSRKHPWLLGKPTILGNPPFHPLKRTKVNPIISIHDLQLPIRGPGTCKKGTPASPAMARASKVLPVPGEPDIITPDPENQWSFRKVVGNIKSPNWQYKSGLYITYHLLREPGTTIERRLGTW